ncbi:MAG: HlyD family efflux transporter periplasmic adaptor subunit [Gammaproteobacteria bacterium]|nr:HlyD family efflux transporter periplasmic adaptor subunit [Gammaproteobacteria bacterium]
MDIQTTLNKKRSASPAKKLIAITVLSLILLSLWAFSSVATNPRIDKSTLRIATVSAGALNVRVDGYGKLRAKYQRLLTSQTQGIVETIELYPGAKVTSDTIILTLSNAQLEQDVATARLELARQNAQFNEQIIAHKSQLLERDAQIALLNSELENARLRLEAETQLVGKGIVSTLDYKRSQLTVKQLKQRLAIERTRHSQLKEMQQQRIKIQRDLISQFELNFQTIARRFSQLKVRAGLNGVLQTLRVEIGQSVSPGTELAMVGSDQQLVAQLRVQQRLADQINIGMAATISTFGTTVAAKVIRIDPIVTDGRVIIELDLTGPLPANARPDLTVEGSIEVKQIANTLLVNQPSDAYGFSTKDIFTLTPDGKTAQLTSTGRKLRNKSK